MTRPLVGNEQRLRQVESGLTEQRTLLLNLDKNMTSLRSELQEARLNLTQLVTPISAAVMGDNLTAGLRERVRTLERNEENRRWILGVLFTLVLGVLFKAVYDWVGHVSSVAQTTEQAVGKTGG